MSSAAAAVWCMVQLLHRPCHSPQLDDAVRQPGPARCLSASPTVPEHAGRTRTQRRSRHHHHLPLRELVRNLRSGSFRLVYVRLLQFIPRPRPRPRVPKCTAALRQRSGVPLLPQGIVLQLSHARDKRPLIRLSVQRHLHSGHPCHQSRSRSRSRVLS